ncbi:hypothetical protein KP79_PYT02043 [Mizuhopecten yessoensis]|uniref:C2H2-type domain-containing protein n=1 Tax=Mizuhopecten yessoensis TaxID=6573 RepID=A0A210Q1F7_MIZYE|nr:hypothetical protein KP79_PYT02043 [Mizuhopecten yessoensis]
MECPVAACGNKRYPRYNQLARHWALTHLEYTDLFRCPLCTFTTTRRNQVRRHLVTRHRRTQAEAMSLIGLHQGGSTQRNTRYISPGGQRMPRRGVTPRAQELRREAELSRYLEAEGNTAMDLGRTAIISRDQEVTPDGIIRDSARWYRNADAGSRYTPQDVDFSLFPEHTE